ncbi:hypothetical protein PhCBS80983_g00778 [Powellomyces hirtus]|uniref:NADAR domain-containing protein n=1 Tax=Powellomyces hirtus TaxID=109895 RepID=A0A507EF60_9FUNG|nr:hypothetical protein PhCBS80983_g00778 [Powellomyces hirtus]
MHDEPIYFWKTSENPYGVFSQWATTPFIDPDTGTQYRTAEHYMMHQKALLFNDTAVATRILRETRPITVKQLGQQVQGFSQHIWEQNRLSIVTRANLLKFEQDEQLKALLVGTGDQEIVEASPYDRIWGIGFQAHKTSVRDRRRWGLNLLGRALMDVRAALK